MLKFYVPSMNGVDVVLAESGMEPMGGVWSGNFTELSSFDAVEITMDAGVCRKATNEEVNARMMAVKYKEVLAEPDLKAKTSGIWRVFTQEQIDAINAAEAKAEAKAQADTEAAQEEAQKNLELITPASIQGLRDGLISLINARFPDKPIAAADIVAATQTAVAVQLDDRKKKIEPIKPVEPIIEKP